MARRAADTSPTRLATRTVESLEVASAAVVAPIYDGTGFYVEGDSGVATQLDAGPRRFARIRKQ